MRERRKKEKKKRKDEGQRTKMEGRRKGKEELGRTGGKKEIEPLERVPEEDLR